MRGGARRASLRRDSVRCAAPKWRASITIADGTPTMGRVMSAVFFRFSFHGCVRTLLRDLANTIGVTRRRGHHCCSPPWLDVPFASGEANRWRWLRRRGGRSRVEQNRVAIQRRLWAVTVSQSERLNRRLPHSWYRTPAISRSPFAGSLGDPPKRARAYHRVERPWTRRVTPRL